MSDFTKDVSGLTTGEKANAKTGIDKTNIAAHMMTVKYIRFNCAFSFYLIIPQGKVMPNLWKTQRGILV